MRGNILTIPTTCPSGTEVLQRGNILTIPTTCPSGTEVLQRGNILTIPTTCPSYCRTSLCEGTFSQSQPPLPHIVGPRCAREHSQNPNHLSLGNRGPKAREHPQNPNDLSLGNRGPTAREHRRMFNHLSLGNRGPTARGASSHARRPLPHIVGPLCAREHRRMFNHLSLGNSVTNLLETEVLQRVEHHRMPEDLSLIL